MGKHSVRAAGASQEATNEAAKLANTRENVIHTEVSPSASSSYCGVRRSLREARRREAAEQIIAQPMQREENASCKNETSETSQPVASEQVRTPIVPPVVTPSASIYGVATSYAEYMNACFAPERMEEVTIETPRRFTGLFSRSRVATAALAVAMLGFSGGAMAATGEPVPATKTAAVQADTDGTETGEAAAGQLAVANAVTFNVAVDGATKVVTAKEGETLGEALSDAEIYLGADDEVSLSLSTPVSAGMDVKIARVTTKTITEPFKAAYATRKEETSDLEKGTTKTVQEGVDGAGMRTSIVYYRDGKEFKRDVQLETITQAPQDKVIQVGTRAEVAPPAAPSGTVSGTKTDWMAAAGIPESDWGYVDYIVSREAGWNPSAYNGSSGACGLAQALPCSKLGPNWDDPVVALKWQYNYVNSRYGGYAGAYAFWTANHWY